MLNSILQKKFSRKIQSFAIRSPPRHVNRFEWNYGGVYSSTRAIAWGTFPLPVGTLKPEVGYFAMKPTIFRYKILPWVMKKWFRVDWVTFQYRWNRKHRKFNPFSFIFVILELKIFLSVAQRGHGAKHKLLKKCCTSGVAHWVHPVDDSR